MKDLNKGLIGIDKNYLCNRSNVSFISRPLEATIGRVRSQAAKGQGRENEEKGGADPSASPWLLRGNRRGADISGLALRMR